MYTKITFVPIGGLCNRIRAMASGVFISKKSESVINIYWKKDKDCFADFTDLFLPVEIENVNVRPFKKSDFYLEMSMKKNLFIPGMLRKIIYDSQVRGLYEQQNDDVFKKISGEKAYIISGYSFTKHYPLNELFVPAIEIQNRINKLKESFKPVMAGIHIRRGDNTNSIGKKTLEDFFKIIDLEIEKIPETYFYLSSDSLDVKRELSSRYGERIILNDAVLERNSLLGMKHAVIDLFCLASTKKIIGSYYSSFSDIAAEIGNAELII